MKAPRDGVHLSRCDHCGQKIAWSRKRRQWLALAPRTELPGRPLPRRMSCPAASTSTFHDPRTNLFGRAYALVRGGTR